MNDDELTKGYNEYNGTMVIALKSKRHISYIVCGENYVFYIASDRFCNSCANNSLELQEISYARQQFLQAEIYVGQILHRTLI